VSTASPPVRAAIVGAAGRHARAHLIPAHRAIGTRITHVIDPDPLVHEVARDLGAEIVSDARDLRPEDVDCAIVALPPRLQPVVAAVLLEAGLPVFCEKPLASSVQALDALRSVAFAPGAPPFMCGFMFRYSPAARTLRSMIHNGELGEIRCVSLISRYPIHPSTRWRFETGGGITHLNAIHFLDLVPWLLQASPADVYALLRVEPSSPEQALSATVRMADGAAFQLDCAWWPFDRNDRITRLEIVGSRGRVVQSDIWQGSDLEVVGPTGSRTMPLPAYDRPSMYRRQAQAFVDCLRSNTRPDPGPLAGINAMLFAEAILQSSDLRQAVAVTRTREVLAV
jgi:predicted dehydrogenase